MEKWFDILTAEEKLEMRQSQRKCVKGIASLYSAEQEMVLKPGACIIKFITAVIYGFRNKLECLSLNTRLG